MADQIGKWKTVRIFISSTFSDMHAERDHLVRVVFPELKERCRKKRVHLIDVDLRWGVTEKDAQEGKALDICLDEIDSCRPYFLGLLGHRYGHIPPGHHHSITAQEIYHGVLNNDIPTQVVDLRSIIEGRFEGRRLSNEQINTLVKCYPFEDRKYILKKDISMEDENIIRSVFVQYSAYQRDRSFFFFRKESLSLELANNRISDFFDECQEDREKLKALKQAIIDEDLLYFEYDSIEKFGEVVRDTLWSHIEKEIEQTPEAEKDWLKEEQELHELFMVDRTRLFVGHRDLLDKMNKFCSGSLRTALTPNAPTSNIMVITGEPGCGKSALMARFSEEVIHQHPDWIILPHFIGSSPNSTSLRLMLKRFCIHIYKVSDLENQKIERLHQITGNDEKAQKEREVIEKEFSIPEDYKELVQTFPQFIKKAAPTHRLLFIIDAVNQLEKTDNAHNMNWLPQELPENVRFVISTLTGDAHDALMKRRITPVEEIVHGLYPADVQELVREYLKEIRHEFPNKQVEVEFFVKVKAGNPLYILVALEELRVFGRFEELPQRVAELPDNVPALFDQVIQRIENDFNPALVKDMLSYIACGRYGMTAEELQTLLKGHAPKHPQRVTDKTSLSFPQAERDGNPSEKKDSGQAGMTELEVEAAKLPDMLWARLHRSFSSYLFERLGVIDFFHGQLKEAVGKRYLSEEAERYRVRKIIADYFESRWREPYNRALDELPLQRTKAKDWEGVERVLTDLFFIEKKCAAGMTYELIGDYDEALYINVADRFWNGWERVDKFRRFIVTQAFVLHENPDIVFQQALISVEPSVQEIASKIRRLAPVLKKKQQPDHNINDVYTIRAHDKTIRACRFLNNPIRLLTCAQDGRLVISDPFICKIEQSVKIADIATDLDVDMAKKTVWLCADGKLYQYDLFSNKSSKINTSENIHWINCKFLESINTVLLGSAEGILALYQCETDKISLINETSGLFNRWYLSNKIAVGISLSAVYLYDLIHKCQRDWYPQGLPTAIAFHPNGSDIAVALPGILETSNISNYCYSRSLDEIKNNKGFIPPVSIGTTLQILDTNLVVRNQIAIRGDFLFSIHYTSDGCQIYGIGGQHKLRIWSHENVSLLKEYKLPGTESYCCELNKTIGFLAAGGADGMIRIIKEIGI